MQENKKKVEAVLFTTGRFLNLEDVGKLCGVGSVGYIKQALEELSEDYDKRDTALEIIKDENLLLNDINNFNSGWDSLSRGPFLNQLSGETH